MTGGRMRRCRLAALAMIWLAGFVGCSANDGRQPVTGMVTVDGRPLLTGSISFRPAPSNHSPSSGATVRDGEYMLSAAQGLRPGKYLVTIQAFQETGRTIEDPQAGARAEILPVVFCEVRPQEVTVVESVPNQFDFTLTTHPGRRR